MSEKKWGPRLEAMFADLRADLERMKREREEWVRTPLPPYFHSCRKWANRFGNVNGHDIGRCPCGGIRFDGHWAEKNRSRAYHRAQREALLGRER